MTISFHNGHVAHRAHNSRDQRVIKDMDHIDPNGRCEVWIDEEPAAAYERIFGEAVREYDAEQSRPERRIGDYFRKIQQSDRKHPVYEAIVTIGNGHGELPDPSVGYEILREFVDGWKARNPRLELIGAYYHADEPGAAPHVHLDYVPVYHSQRGMRLQTGLARALQEEGFRYDGRHATEQIQWQNRERGVLEGLCVFRGYHIEHPARELQHVETRLYKARKELQMVTRRYNAVIAAAGLATNIIRSVEKEVSQSQERSR